MCLAGAVVPYCSLTQEVAGSSPFTVMTNIFVTEFAEKLHWRHCKVQERYFVLQSSITTHTHTLLRHTHRCHSGHCRRNLLPPVS